MGEVVLGAVGALGGGRAAALNAEQHLALLSFLCDEALDTAALRNVLPDLVSNTLEVVKLTSIAGVVALPELLFQARQAQSVTYNPTPILVAAALYFALLWPVVRLLSRLENRAIAGG